MIKMNQKNHMMNERNLMVLSDNPWLVKLYYPFQDMNYLYLAMKYCPGGDFIALLMNKDILSENDTKFFMAETLLSIESIHKMKYSHRDLKPDNLLFDKNGHIKLSDFGLYHHFREKR